MDRAFVEWDEDVIRLADAGMSRHPLLGGKGLFSVLGATLDQDADLWRGLRLLYIGRSGQGTLRAALTEDAPHFEKINAALLDGEEAIVMLGTITSTLGRMTSSFLDDVMTCLIARHKARCNERIKGPYHGRKISVVNRGDHRPLKPKCLLRPAKTNAQKADSAGEADKG